VPPTELKSLPKSPAGQLFCSVACSCQSPTSSHTFPTMPNVPHFETHAGALPVVLKRGVIELLMLHAAGRPEVPAAARCHSWFVTRRLFESAHAGSAWNPPWVCVGAPGCPSASR